MKNRDVSIEIQYRNMSLRVYSNTSDEELLRCDNVSDEAWCKLHRMIMFFDPWEEEKKVVPDVDQTV
jgi:hypothetical protein|tara:strand:+ start:378 stop:578 length:201 start_codon:yes stop_codon:yes gene_type:complete